jgi:two-component system chemotaxis response regulator CheB
MFEKPKQVLIVDDSALVRTLIKQIIAVDPDFEVIGEAGDSTSAIARAMSSKPDIVILDIEMPKMNGIEVIKRLKLFSKARIIVLSSVAQLGSDVAQEAKRLGAFDVIPKPSGAISLDLKAKRGHVILQILHTAAGLPPPDFQAMALRIKSGGV